MTDSNWFRVEGMVIAGQLDPRQLAEYLRKESIVAQLEWFDVSPELVGIRVAYNGENVGKLSARGKKVQPGPTLLGFATGVAETFEAEVMIGEVSVDHFVEKAADKPQTAEAKQDAAPIRVVEISATPSSAIPLLAAFEGVDIGEIDHSADTRALLAQVPSHRKGWHFGDAPLVALTVQGDEFEALLIRDEDPENVVSYNWGMNELTVVGAKGWEGETPMDIHALVGSFADIEEMQKAVPGADLASAFAATQSRGPAAVRQFVHALGLEEDVAEFLLGWLTLEQVESATVHYARGISNAIGRSVDMLLEERQEGSRFWEIYSNMISSKPWLIPMISSLEVAAGTSLLIISRRRGEKRTVAAKFGTAVGVMLLVDSVAELTLAKYTLWREERRAAQ